MTLWIYLEWDAPETTVIKEMEKNKWHEGRVIVTRKKKPLLPIGHLLFSKLKHRY